MPLLNRYAFRIRPSMRRGLRTEVPLPTRLVSNEEFPPQPQTAAQQEVEATDPRSGGATGAAARSQPPEFLRSSGGMAVSLLALNTVFGRFFDVLDVEAAEPAAFLERTGEPFLSLTYSSITLARAMTLTMRKLAARGR